MDCQCLALGDPGILFSGIVSHTGVSSTSQAAPRTLLKEEDDWEP